MGRKVKLLDTGGYGDSAINFKAPNGKYYTNEDAYNLIQKDNEYWKKSVNELLRIIGYKENMKLPSIVSKKLNEVRNYGMDVVYDTIIGLEEDGKFEYAQKKSFSSEYGRVAYFCSIIVNSVGDYYMKAMREKKLKKKDVVIEQNIDLDFANVGGKNKNKDISNLLGEI